MRRGMAEYKKRVGIFFGENLQLHVVVERAAQVDQLAFTVVFLCVLTGRGCGDARHEGGICKTRRYAPGDIRRRGALGNVLDAAVRQRDVNLIHVRVHLEGETLTLSAAPLLAQAMTTIHYVAGDACGE